MRIHIRETDASPCGEHGLRGEQGSIRRDDDILIGSNAKCAKAQLNGRRSATDTDSHCTSEGVCQLLLEAPYLLPQDESTGLENGSAVEHSLRATSLQYGSEVKERDFSYRV